MGHLTSEDQVTHLGWVTFFEKKSDPSGMGRFFETSALGVDGDFPERGGFGPDRTSAQGGTLLWNAEYFWESSLPWLSTMPGTCPEQQKRSASRGVTLLPVGGMLHS